MRKISFLQIVVFNALVLPPLFLALITARVVLLSLPANDVRGVASVAAGLASLYVYLILSYRVFIHVFCLLPGDIPPGSRQEFVYHVYILFYLIFFYPIIRSGLLPTPLMRVFYLALGTKLGKNTYSQGIIHDPPFVVIGSNSTVGQSALLIPHVIEGKRIAHHFIRIGDDVIIGAASVLLSDVVVGDKATIAAGAVVKKGTRIGPGETWAGVPARRIRSANANFSFPKTTDRCSAPGCGENE